MRLEFHLLGHFDLRDASGPLDDFESQKVRALAVLLALHAPEPLSRDEIVEMLWVGEAPGTGRRNLSQALYNLRKVLSRGRGAPEVILGSHESLRFAPGVEVWVDAREFEESAREGLDATTEASVRPALGRAVQLYAGDLLAHFPVRGAEEFETAVSIERERLRELAIGSSRRLLALFEELADYEHAIHLARRLVALDPLLEDGYLALMRCYARTGRVGRAIEVFEDLRGQLRHELGIEPSGEATELHDQVAARCRGAVVGRRGEERVGPVVPLVGRSGAMAALEEAWRDVLRGRSHRVVVSGAMGMGKSRLLRTFLYRVVGEDALILHADAGPHEPRLAYQLFRDALAPALSPLAGDEVAGGPGGDAEPPEGLSLELPAILLDDLRRFLRPDSSPPGDTRAETAEAARRRVEALLLRLVQRLGEEQGSHRPVVVFFDNLEAADLLSRSLFARLTTSLPDRSLLVLGALSDTSTGNGSSRCGVPAAGAPLHIRLDRLRESDALELVGALVGRGEARRLLELLRRSDSWMPLSLTEGVNLLRDEGLLVGASDGGWALASRGLLKHDRIPAGPASLVQRRIKRLPAGARHVLTVASVLGLRFDLEVLREVSGQPEGLVAVSVEQLIGNWMLRYSPPYWQRRRERDLLVWQRGARRGRFEFSHPLLQQVVYCSVAPAVRRELHAAAAAALDRRGAAGRPELLAYHLFRAEEWGRAAEAVAALRRHALALGDAEGARRLAERSAAALQRERLAG